MVHLQGTYFSQIVIDIDLTILYAWNNITVVHRLFLSNLQWFYVLLCWAHAVGPCSLVDYDGCHSNWDAGTLLCPCWTLWLDCSPPLSKSLGQGEGWQLTLMTELKWHIKDHQLDHSKIFMTLVVTSKRKMEKINYKARQCKFIYRALIHTYSNSKRLTNLKTEQWEHYIMIKYTKIHKIKQSAKKKKKKNLKNSIQIVGQH